MPTPPPTLSWPQNGDGVVSLQELEAGLKPKTRRKIEEKLDAGWKFDAEAWAASVARHARWNMAKVFKQFDADGDGKLDIYELARAFRAIGLTKRNGDKYVLDETHFRGFDTSGARVAPVIPNPKKACASKLPFHTGVLRGCILPAGRVA